MTLSKALKKACHDSKLTTYALAKGSGLDYAILRRFLEGERSLMLESAEKLAVFFKLTLTTTRTKQ
jgi:transcriptional regulator with XRE-family HTH domain